MQMLGICRESMHQAILHTIRSTHFRWKRLGCKKGPHADLAVEIRGREIKFRVWKNSGECRTYPEGCLLTILDLEDLN